jgi:hypothetical protein
MRPAAGATPDVGPPSEVSTQAARWRFMETALLGQGRRHAALLHWHCASSDVMRDQGEGYVDGELRVEIWLAAYFGMYIST